MPLIDDINVGIVHANGYFGCHLEILINMSLEENGLKTYNKRGFKIKTFSSFVNYGL